MRLYYLGRNDTSQDKNKSQGQSINQDQDTSRNQDRNCGQARNHGRDRTHDQDGSQGRDENRGRDRSQSQDRSQGQGLKMVSGSISLAILTSWFVSAVRQEISPSEAIVVLLMLINLAYPAKTTLMNPHTVAGETLGLCILVLVELGTCGALLWVLTRLFQTLPTLGTDNVVFFFARVAIDGWFRYLALVYCVIDAIMSISFAYKVLRVSKIAWSCYEKGDDKLDNDDLKEVKRIVKWGDIECIAEVFGWLLWVCLIIAVELTLRWNHLSPSTDLQSPGQLIPLTAGLLMLLDSISVFGRLDAVPNNGPDAFRDFFNCLVCVINLLERGVQATEQAVKGCMHQTGRSMAAVGRSCACLTRPRRGRPGNGQAEGGSREGDGGDVEMATRAKP